MAASTPGTGKGPMLLVITAVVLVAVIVVLLLARKGSGPDAAAEPELAASEPGSRAPVETSPSFDLQLELDASPLGLTFRGDDMIVTNRLEPWGLVVVHHQGGGSFEQDKRPVIESTNNQRISLDTVTWNGSHLVCITEGSWVEAGSEDVFLLLDPESLAIKWWYPAPPRLGALVWDGAGYWAATRRNTEGANEPAFLYRINSDLEVVERSAPPAVGCQGLAVHENLLYFADVFTGSLTVLDTSVQPPRVVERMATGLDYLSGVGHDGERLWVAEYGSDRLLRVGDQVMASSPRPPVRHPETEIVELPSEEDASSKESLRELRAMLRSQDSFERLHARNELQQRDEVPDFDRQEESVSKNGPEDASVHWWQAEMAKGTITASWEIFFGPALFSERSEYSDGPVSVPLFVRYSIEIAGGELAQPLTLDLEGQPGVQTVTDQVLATGLDRGTYRLSLFMHVQYVQPREGAKILNTSAFPLEVGW